VIFQMLFGQIRSQVFNNAGECHPFGGEPPGECPPTHAEPPANLVSARLPMRQ
jgi:hypothetical protein